MLRCFTGVAISDFGCAFNAYRRTAVEPSAAIGKQKFTKAVVLSGGASVVEVDVNRRARRPLELLAAAPAPARAARARRLRRSRSSGSGSRSASPARSWRPGSGSTGSGTGSTAPTSWPLLGGVAVLFVLGIQGFILALVGSTLGRIQREVEDGLLHDRASCEQARLLTGGAGFISSNFIRYLLAHTDHQVVSLDALTYAGNLENLADVMSHERLSFVHGDISRSRARREARGRGRRDRQRGRGSRTSRSRSRRARPSS